MTKRFHLLSNNAADQCRKSGRWSGLCSWHCFKKDVEKVGNRFWLCGNWPLRRQQAPTFNPFYSNLLVACFSATWKIWQVGFSRVSYRLCGFSSCSCWWEGFHPTPCESSKVTQQNVMHSSPQTSVWKAWHEPWHLTWTMNSWLVKVPGSVFHGFWNNLATCLGSISTRFFFSLLTSPKKKDQISIKLVIPFSSQSMGLVYSPRWMVDV